MRRKNLYMRINNIEYVIYMGNMPSLNLYMDDKTKKKLEEIAAKENRSISKQVKHMMEFYISYFERDMDDLIGSGWYPAPERKTKKNNVKD